MLAAVQQNGWVFESASDQLKGDRNFVLTAVQQNDQALFGVRKQKKNFI